MVNVPYPKFTPVIAPYGDLHEEKASWQYGRSDLFALWKTGPTALYVAINISCESGAHIG